MDMDFSKYCDLVWLWNAAAMFFISFFTNYWQYNEYDYKSLIKTLSIEKIYSKNETTIDNQFHLTVDGWDTFKWHHLLSIDLFFVIDLPKNGRACRKLNSKEKGAVVVEFEWTSNQCFEHHYRFLYTEYTNLFKECNDLLDDSRELLHGKMLMDLESCHHFILNQHQWRDFHRLQLIGVLEHFAFGLGCASFVAMTTSLVVGTYGALFHKTRLEHIAGLCLSIFAVFYALTVIIFFTKMQILEHYLTHRSSSSSGDNLSTNDLANRTAIRALDRLIDRSVKVSFGWSMVAAIFAACLSAVASQFFIVGSRTVKKRRKSQYRRRRMEAAMVSPCEQEVALAMRAQMIVI